jgi:SAM-dependent methyltransferase
MMSIGSFNDEKFGERFLAHRLEAGSLFHDAEHAAMGELLTAATIGPLLELGCGPGGKLRDFARRGFGPLSAVDISKSLLDRARQEAGDLPVEFMVADMCTVEFAENAFATIVSSLAIHFIEDIEPMFAKIFRWLSPGGTFLFSVRHPIRTSNPTGQVCKNEESWIVDNYLSRGSREWNWLGAKHAIFHRTVEDYVATLLGAGFIIEFLREVGLGSPGALSSSPAFLLVSASKH